MEYNVQNIAAGQSEYVLDLKAKTAAVAYDKVKMWVEKKAVVPTKIECYAATGLLIKTLYLKEIRPFEGVRRPSVIETDSPLYKGYQSIIAYANVKKKVFADEAFTLDFLPKIETLR